MSITINTGKRAIVIDELEKIAAKSSQRFGIAPQTQILIRTASTLFTRAHCLMVGRMAIPMALLWYLATRQHKIRSKQSLNALSKVNRASRASRIRNVK